jgi:hypothetical protein
MERTNFEPFGEHIELRERRGQTRSSRSLLWIGSSLFWTIAVSIVVMRAIYFEPGIYDQFIRAAAFIRVPGIL